MRMVNHLLIKHSIRVTNDHGASVQVQLVAILVFPVSRRKEHTVQFCLLVLCSYPEMLSIKRIAKDHLQLSSLPEKNVHFQSATVVASQAASFGRF